MRDANAVHDGASLVSEPHVPAHKERHPLEILRVVRRLLQLRDELANLRFKPVAVVHAREPRNLLQLVAPVLEFNE